MKTARSKYGAKRCEVNGYKFASLLERERYLELSLLQLAGAISYLAVHPSYSLHAFGHRIGKYIADFSYSYGPDGQIVVEDCKGIVTQLARWKLKHFEAEYGFAVTIIRKQDKRKAWTEAYASHRGKSA